ncbi:MAG: 30S ribosomal protein S16 [Acidimicrobiales bacterium]
MAVRLRLMRMGKKKQPTYRVVAADQRSPRDGRFIEIVGTYNPRREPSEILIDNAKAVGWLRKGAQPSERVRKLLEISGAWAAYTGGTSVEELQAQQDAAKAAAAAAEAELAAPAAVVGSPA